MNAFTQKLKEVIQSVLPIILFVILLHFTVVPLESRLLWAFLLGAVFIILGLTLFLLGVDISITPIAEYVGKGLVKSNKLSLVLILSLTLGFFTSAAEPSLGVLASQIEAVTSGGMAKNLILFVVAAGVSVTLTIGVLRVLYSLSILPILIGIFGTMFILAFFSSTEFFSIAFDASGATTGALAVPFFLALSTGMASLKKGSKSSEEESFGMVALASTGAVLSTLLLNVLSSKDSVSGSLPEQVAHTGSLASVYLTEMKELVPEVILSLLPIVVIFLIFNAISLHVPRKRVRRIFVGVIYVLIGLNLFLTGVNAGFMEVGSVLGQQLATGNPFLILFMAFILGVVTILAEPAVSVLIRQIEDVTGGAIKRPLILTSLSLGVGLAISGSVLKMMFSGLNLWHFIVPGYTFALILAFFVPKIFIGMAFDAGSVASGPMAATFILAFIQGAAQQIPTADLIKDGFGMIAMVAMMPIIILMLVGFFYGRNQETKNE